jgi:hypothetical protein
VLNRLGFIFVGMVGMVFILVPRVVGFVERVLSRLTGVA